MAYVSLYRKYRPQTFMDIVGQDHVTGTLVNAIQTGQVHHAMLFCGTRGTGKTSTARVLAKALNADYRRHHRANTNKGALIHHMLALEPGKRFEAPSL